MKLDRNVNPSGLGKYELINSRTGREVADCHVGQQHEFFVIMLKDRHALAALQAYAESINGADPEFAEEVLDLATRAGVNSFWCKDPD